MNTENRRGGLGEKLVVALALALVAGALLSVWLIGSDTLKTMGLILVGAVAFALVIGSLALPIRAWRRKDFVGDHYHTDGTRTIVKETRVLDGRVAEGPKLYQLPAQPQGTAFPDLLRAAYAAGARALPAPGSRPTGGEADYAESDLREVDLGAEWDGDIRG